MFEAERVDRLVLHLPGDNACPSLVAIDDACDELRRCHEERRVVGGSDACALAQRIRQTVVRHEELRVAERLERADAHHDLFTGVLGGVDLPIEIASVEDSRSRLDPVPVRPQTDQLELMRQQASQRRSRVEAERVDLRWAEADAQASRAPRLHRQRMPGIGERLA